MATKAKAAGRRLKVYRAAFGFHESVVAAPNQKAALEAWGVRQNLFAEGEASVTTDEATVTAALAQPGVPLSRPVGGEGHFGLVKKSERRATRPKPDRRALDAAERELADLEKAQSEARAAFEEKVAALKAEAKAVQADLGKRLAEARRAVASARRAYVKAGGRPAA